MMSVTSADIDSGIHLHNTFSPCPREVRVTRGAMVCSPVCDVQRRRVNFFTSSSVDSNNENG